MEKLKIIGVIWDEEIQDGEFTEDGLLEAYSVVGKLAGEKDIRIVHGHFEDYENGSLKRAYVLDDGRLEEREATELDAVFDKFKYDDSTRELKKRMNSELPVLNSFELEEICKDKLLTYQEFPDHVPRTLKASRKDAEEMIRRDGKVVVKPRFEFGGRGVKVIDSIDEFENGDGLLLQEFVDSSSGIRELGVQGMHDLRVLIASGEPVAAYVRQPNEGYVANVSLGGSMEFVELANVPESAATIVEEVKESFERFDPSFYSIDMIFDGNGSARILEFNSKPGLGFHGDSEIKANKIPVMEKVVEQLAKL